MMMIRDELDKLGLTVHDEHCTNKYAFNINLPCKRALSMRCPIMYMPMHTPKYWIMRGGTKD
jgi:hypothetical protein